VGRKPFTGRGSLDPCVAISQSVGTVMLGSRFLGWQRLVNQCIMSGNIK